MPLTEQQQLRLDYLKSLVTSRMDELMPQPVGAEESGSGSDQVEAVTADVPVGNLEKEIEYAAIHLIRILPKTLLTGLAVAVSSPTGSNYGDKGYLVPMPADFVRFVRLRLNGWTRPVTELETTDSPDYHTAHMRYSPFNISNPKAFYVIGLSEGNSVPAAECYPRSGSVSELVYVPETKPYDMPEKFDSAMCWYAASTAFMIMRLPELARLAMARFEEQANQLKLGLVDEQIVIDSKGRRVQ